jgi:hypothetical protein
MSQTVGQSPKADLLTALEKPSPAKANLPLTRRETAADVLRLAVRKSDLLLKQIGDHGQISRQIAGVENLSFHHMFATWPPEVWRELLPLLAVEFGVEMSIRVSRSA